MGLDTFIAAAALTAATGAEALAQSSPIPGGDNPEIVLRPSQAPPARPASPQAGPPGTPEAEATPAVCREDRSAEIARAEKMLELVWPGAQTNFNIEMTRAYGVPPLNFSVLASSVAGGADVLCMPDQKASKEDHPAVDGHTVWARKTGQNWAITPAVTDDGMPCTTVSTLAAISACNAGLNGPGDSCNVMTGIDSGLPSGVAGMVAESVWNTCLEQQEELLEKTNRAGSDDTGLEAEDVEPEPEGLSQHSHLDSFTLEDGERGLVDPSELENFTGKCSLNLLLGDEVRHVKATLSRGKLMEATALNGNFWLKDLSGGGISLDLDKDLLSLPSESYIEMGMTYEGKTWRFEGSAGGLVYEGDLFIDGQLGPAKISAEFAMNFDLSSFPRLEPTVGDFIWEEQESGIKAEGKASDLKLSSTPGSFYEVTNATKDVTVTYSNGNKLSGKTFLVPSWKPVDGVEYTLDQTGDGYDIKFRKEEQSVTITEYENYKIGTLTIPLKVSGGATATYSEYYPRWNRTEKTSANIVLTIGPGGPSFYQTTTKWPGDSPSPTP